MIVYDWLTDDQIEELVNPALALRGMALLNINPLQPTCRVLGAWNDGRFITFLAFHLYPVLGPLVKTDALYRDNGEVSRELTTRMHAFLDACDARGYLVVADSPITSRLCERHGMVKIESPIYAAVERSIECNNYTSEVLQ